MNKDFVLLLKELDGWHYKINYDDMSLEEGVQLMALLAEIITEVAKHYQNEKED